MYCLHTCASICVASQGRTLEQFDHVQKGLSVDDPEASTSSVKNMSEDLKRALGALQVRVRAKRKPVSS